MKRVWPFVASRMSSALRLCSHQYFTSRASRLPWRSGFTCMRKCSNGASYRAASSSAVRPKKSTIHLCGAPPSNVLNLSKAGLRHCWASRSDWLRTETAEPLRRSRQSPRPFAGTETEVLVSHAGLRPVSCRSELLRLGLIRSTGLPSSNRLLSAPASKPIMLTCTVAPARIQSRSLTAKKMSPVSLMRFKTSRFAPPRIPWVASKPARLHLPVRFVRAPFQTNSSKGQLPADSDSRGFQTAPQHMYRQARGAEAFRPETADCSRARRTPAIRVRCRT